MAEILAAYDALIAERDRIPEIDGAKRREIDMEIANLKKEYRDMIYAGRV